MKVKVGNIGTYSFSASAGTITFGGMPLNLSLDDILLITNVTDSEMIYVFNNSDKGGSISNNILTLNYNTTGMADTDELQIFIDIPISFDANASKYNSSTTYHADAYILSPNESVNMDIHSKVYAGGSAYDLNLARTLSPTDTEVGFMQVFRASTDNIHDASFSMESVTQSNSETVIFDCEYATEANVEADWVSTDEGNSFDIDSDTDPVYTGTYCLKLRLDNGTGETATHTYGTVQNWSTSTSIKLAIQNEISGVGGSIRFIIEDSSNNQMYFDFTTNSPDVWEVKNEPFTNFTGYASVDMSSIKYLRWEVLHANKYKIYIDDIRLVDSEASSTDVLFELYDFGTTANPTTIGVPMTLDEGGTDTEREIKPIHGARFIHLHRGSHNTTPSQKLTIGNYYGILIRKPVEGQVELYGNTTSQAYTSGKCYTLTGTTLTEVPNTSLGFAIFSCVPGVIKDITATADDLCNGSYLYFMNTSSTGALKEIKMVKEFIGDNTTISISYDYSLAEQWSCDEDNIPLTYFTPGSSISANEVEFEVNYHYNSFNIYI